MTTEKTHCMAEPGRAGRRMRPTGDVPVAVACELGVCPWNLFALRKRPSA